MIPAAEDPRPRGASEADIRPVVARRGRNLPIWLVGGLAVLGAVLLFGALETQRQARTAPATQVRIADGVRMSTTLPPLYMASERWLPPPPPPPPPPELLSAAPAYQPSPPPTPPAPSYTPAPAPGPSPSPVYLPQQPVADPQRATSRGEILVVDTTRSVGGPGGTNAVAATGAEASAGGPAGGPAAGSAAAVRSTRLPRRATTVPQGALIPAVLETALDSTRPGHVRAMVSRDVTGFDGSQVLIPRGSRLFGEYEADLAPGQNRAFVRWTQLVLPDGVSIAIESPAADRLGRTGIEGRVDNHFLQRFGSAFLQSVLNFGSGWAGRSIGGDNPVIVALPGSTQGGGASLTGAQVQPTLRVDAGVTVTVFVARDLEFPARGIRR